jgi:NAD(P)-dependent dehydrogenase (short-subunit alcohol dehydrogenase family)
MSQSLAKYLGPYNIYVTAVAPGFVETDMATDFLQGPQGDEIRDHEGGEEPAVQRIARFHAQQPRSDGSERACERE